MIGTTYHRGIAREPRRRNQSLSILGDEFCLVFLFFSFSSPSSPPLRLDITLQLSQQPCNMTDLMTEERQAKICHQNNPSRQHCNDVCTSVCASVSHSLSLSVDYYFHASHPIQCIYIYIYIKMHIFLGKKRSNERA